MTERTRSQRRNNRKNRRLSRVFSTRWKVRSSKKASKFYERGFRFELLLKYTIEQDSDYIRKAEVVDSLNELGIAACVRVQRRNIRERISIKFSRKEDLVIFKLTTTFPVYAIYELLPQAGEGCALPR